MSAPVIEVSGLRKTYGSTVAVDDVSLTVRRGEIVGILGPNGAGKTTTVECIAGLRAPDGGTVRVLGLDPQQDGAALRDRVSLQLQDSELPARIRVREAIELYASFYADPADPDELLDALGLQQCARSLFSSLSGGQKQRLSVALALVGNPQIAILDELTTGLDPQARRDTWDLVERVRDRGVTILLVTHFMEEAERLCDSIVLIDAGRVVGQGTPVELAAGVDTEVVLRLAVDGPGTTSPAHALGLLAHLDAVVTGPGPDGRYVVRGPESVVQDVMVALAAAGLRARDVHLDRSSLEDAFVTLTHRTREA